MAAKSSHPAFTVSPRESARTPHQIAPRRAMPTHTPYRRMLFPMFPPALPLGPYEIDSHPSTRENRIGRRCRPPPRGFTRLRVIPPRAYPTARASSQPPAEEPAERDEGQNGTEYRRQEDQGPDVVGSCKDLARVARP